MSSRDELARRKIGFAKTLVRSRISWGVAGGVAKYLGRLRYCTIAKKCETDVEFSARADACIRIERHQFPYGLFASSGVLKKVDQFPSSFRAFGQFIRRPVFVNCALIVLNRGTRLFLPLCQVSPHTVERTIRGV